MKSFNEKPALLDFENKEAEKVYGRNCTLRISFLRHANKEKADPHEGGKISQAQLSPKGERASFEKGEVKKSENILARSYVSEIDRTEKTAERYLAGAGRLTEKHKTRKRAELNAPHFSPAFIAEYRKHFAEKPTNFEKLSADEQEQVIEDIEDPAVDFWLAEYWNKKFDAETESAKEVAERVAYHFSKIDTAFERLLDKAPSDSEADLLDVTHRCTMEPFLKFCLKPEIENFQQIGGSFKLLENFEIFIQTDEQGEKHYKAIFREKEYEVDLEKVMQLKDDYTRRVYRENIS